MNCSQVSCSSLKALGLGRLNAVVRRERQLSLVFGDISEAFIGRFVFVGRLAT
jgi:hypothetical protein